MRAMVCAAFVIFGLAVPAVAEQSAPAAVPVGTIHAERKAISRSMEFVGRIEAVNRVEIRARVKGYLEAVLFKEGDTIKTGTPLYRIEKGQFEAAVQQAQGTLERSKAAHGLAILQLQRAEELVEKASGTVVARDQAKAQLQQTAGAMMTDQGNLDTAKINLGYAEIASPIDGKIGRTHLTKGNVVSPESGMLTIVVSQDPMYVTFPVSQRILLQAREAKRTNTSDLKAHIRFSDGTTYDKLGEINFVDVTVDRTTDTVLARATMPNPDGILTDNQLVRVSIEIGSPEEKVLIPQSALIADQGGVYVFAIEDGKAVVKRLKVGADSGIDVVVESGLAGGEQIIVEGLQNVRPGAVVRASPITRTVSRN